jgi:hypothetical protein
MYMIECIYVYILIYIYIYVYMFVCVYVTGPLHMLEQCVALVCKALFEIFIHTYYRHTHTHTRLISSQLISYVYMYK